MKTYRITVSQKEYDKLEKRATRKGIGINTVVRMLLCEAKEIQEEKCTLGIYVPYSTETDKRNITLFVGLHKELDEYFLKISSMAKGLKPGKIAQLYLLDMLERKEN